MTTESAQPREPQKLAIHGGPAAFPDGPPAWPVHDDKIHEALTAAWEDGSWGKYHGPHCERLANELCLYHGTSQAMLTCSGTIAVELALRAVGVAAADHVLLAAYDFPGNFRAVEAIGAWPVLVDIQPNSFVTSAEIVAAAIEQHDHSLSAILVSHLHGELVDMPQIMELARRKAIPVVEDACQAMGGRIGGRPLGSLGDVGVLSFGGSKLLTAGRGGAILTNDESALQRAKIFSERGNDAFPLSELQAAVLLPQLHQLDQQTATRLASTRKLQTRSGEYRDCVPVSSAPDTWIPGFFKLGLHIDSSQAKWSREWLVNSFTAEGVAIGEGFRGFAKRSSRRCSRVGDLTESKRAAENTLVLHHPILLASNVEVDKLADTLVKVTDFKP